MGKVMADRAKAGAMRVGVTRSQADISHGGIFQYEQAFIAALAEVSARSTDEIVYLSSGRNDLVTLADSGALTYQGLSVLRIAQARPAAAGSLVFATPQDALADALDPDMNLLRPTRCRTSPGRRGRSRLTTQSRSKRFLLRSALRLSDF